MPEGNEIPRPAENEEERPQRQRGRPKETRSYTLNIDGLDLNSVEGQSELLLRTQMALATAQINSLDLKALIALKDTVKIKKDLEVWPKIVQLLTDVGELKRLQKEKDKTPSAMST